jgi:hypothetical protein
MSNLITSFREFRALCECREYKLMPLLLEGHAQPRPMTLDTLGVGYLEWMTRSFNESQQDAITAAATSQGFTLIKGPPGTGKTTTLKGLLNSLHLREYNRYYNAVLDVARRPDHETATAWASIGREKPHILVAAPSNIAVDNIVGKIMDEGFCDGEGRQYFPQIVRVGRGAVRRNDQNIIIELMMYRTSTMCVCVCVVGQCNPSGFFFIEQKLISRPQFLDRPKKKQSKEATLHLHLPTPFPFHPHSHHPHSHFYHHQVSSFHAA